MGKGIRKQIAAKTAALLSAAMVCNGAFGTVPAYAAEVPACFSVAEIMAAEADDGSHITDETFAQAIYDSIAQQIEDGNYDVSGYQTAKEVMENFGPENVQKNKAKIRKLNENISSIEGIRLLKNCKEITLAENNIHDLSPLAWTGNDEDFIYFSQLILGLNRGNYTRVLPERLIGTGENGSISIDSDQIFDPLIVNYRRTGAESEADRSIYLDFDLELHGEKGGIFNQSFSEQGSSQDCVATWDNYADYETRYEGTTIRNLIADEEFHLEANANEDIPHSMPPTVIYNTTPRTERKLNIKWIWNFDIRQYYLVKVSSEVNSEQGIRFTKTAEDGTKLPGAGYELYMLQDGSPVRCPDSETVYTTGDDGSFEIPGLSPGTYYLKELPV